MSESNTELWQEIDTLHKKLAERDAEFLELQQQTLTQQRQVLELVTKTTELTSHVRTLVDRVKELEAEGVMV